MTFHTRYPNAASSPEALAEAITNMVTLAATDRDNDEIFQFVAGAAWALRYVRNNSALKEIHGEIYAAAARLYDDQELGYL